ncbi:hypothetical protein [Methylomonas fluvii]|nr:hypothetical protein [Methylomonas fluvii]
MATFRIDKPVLRFIEQAVITKCSFRVFKSNFWSVWYVLE